VHAVTAYQPADVRAESERVPAPRDSEARFKTGVRISTITLRA
jgi:hypothetical protein